MDLSGARAAEILATIIKQKIAFCGMSVLRQIFPESFETGNHPDSLQNEKDANHQQKDQITDSQIEKKVVFCL